MKRYLLLALLFMIISCNHVIIAQYQNVSFRYGIGRFNITVLPEGQRETNTDRLLGVTDDMIQELLPEGTYTNAVKWLSLHACLYLCRHIPLMI